MTSSPTDSIGQAIIGEQILNGITGIWNFFRGNNYPYSGSAYVPAKTADKAVINKPVVKQPLESASSAVPHHVVDNTRSAKEIRVFISYAREDSACAKELYDFLKNAGCIPWLDKHNLIPGQDWEREISHALNNSHLAVTVFSSKSLIKVGHVQIEYKHALKLLEKRADGQIYIIPMLVDECEPPESFQKLHWVYYKDSEWKAQIEATLAHIRSAMTVC